MYFIGVDHHKQVSVMTVLEEDGQEWKTGRMPNLRSDFWKTVGRSRLFSRRAARRM